MTTMTLPFRDRYIPPVDDPYGLSNSGDEFCAHGALVAACNDRSCAPPPVGTGGSRPSTGSGSIGAQVGAEIASRPELAALQYDPATQQRTLRHMSDSIWTPNPNITAKTEAAVREVGSMVLSHMSDRLKNEFDRAEVIRAHDERQQRLATAAGVSASDISVDLNGKMTVRGAPAAKVAAAQVVLAQVLKEDPYFESDSRMHTRNAEMILREKIVRETINEISGGAGSAKLSATTHKGLVGSTDYALPQFPDSWVEASNAHRLHLMVQPTTTGRAGYSLGTGVLSGTQYPSEMRHELAHRMEHAVPGIVELEAQFIARRTAGESPVRLMDLNSAYKSPNEITLPDKFNDPYIGRVYKPSTSGMQAYEVLSVGMQFLTQSFGSPKPAIDADHMSFVLGVLATTWRPKP